MASDKGYQEFEEQLVLRQENFSDYKAPELMQYCMLLDTLGDHQGMLNCAIMHVKQTAAGHPMTEHEEMRQRDMFAVACKKYISEKLEQWRILRDKKAHLLGLGQRKEKMAEYLNDFERKLLTHINEIIYVVDTKLIPNCTIDENRVFYRKMLADYFRYSVDFHDKEDSPKYMEAVSEALANYRYAVELGERHLEPTNPIFLALVLNFSVFIYDMLNDVVGAIDAAETAFNNGIKDVKSLEESDHKESTLILQLLRDNLQLWKHAAANDAGTEEDIDPNITTQEPTIEPEPDI